ncbi:endonuclease domain-containing protein [Blastomonas sp. CACIA14H2]|uniref:endonuclease domain-containing protein n=1 Tax=Blastomonas sp. CACIA14H2 TaxID=1419876 RepID=UPI0040580497
MKHHPPATATKLARRLRRDMTDAERRMWTLLRENFPEARFRRQVPLLQYIADFASHRVRLVIEVDGSQHDVQVDAARTAAIEGQGYRVIRFTNYDVLTAEEGVFMVIDSAIRDAHPHPTLLHQGGGH